MIKLYFYYILEMIIPSMTYLVDNSKNNSKTKFVKTLKKNRKKKNYIDKNQQFHDTNYICYVQYKKMWFAIIEKQG